MSMQQLLSNLCNDSSTTTWRGKFVCDRSSESNVWCKNGKRCAWIILDNVLSYPYNSSCRVDWDYTFSGIWTYREWLSANAISCSITLKAIISLTFVTQLSCKYANLLNIAPICYINHQISKDYYTTQWPLNFKGQSIIKINFYTICSIHFSFQF